MRYDAIILAGGQGSRLGGIDKAQLMLAGSPLVDRPLQAASGAERVVLVGPPTLARDGILLTREEPPGGGPAAGTAAGVSALGSTSAPWVLLLSCDLPLATAGVPRLLDAAQVSSDGLAAAVPGSGDERSANQGIADGLAAAQAFPERDAGAVSSGSRVDGYCLTDADGRLQWLFALYRSDALIGAVRGCERPAGTSMRSLLDGLNLVGVDSTEDVAGDLDTWQDHAEWTTRLASGGTNR